MVSDFGINGSVYYAQYIYILISRFYHDIDIGLFMTSSHWTSYKGLEKRKLNRKPDWGSL